VYSSTLPDGIRTPMRAPGVTPASVSDVATRPASARSSA